MVVGSHQIFWHRPLIAYLSLDTGKPAVLPDILLGYLTAYDATHLDLNHPVELWPQLYQRNTPLTVIELFKENKHQHKTITRALNLVAAQELLCQRTRLSTNGWDPCLRLQAITNAVSGLPIS
jgi:hypothetical protein